MTASKHLEASRRVADERWLARVRGEYLEMPGLSLTQVQAQRLWGLDRDACETLLDTLRQRGFLRRTAQGGYVRADVA
jgi:hypothetical protein